MGGGDDAGEIGSPSSGFHKTGPGSRAQFLMRASRRQEEGTPSSLSPPKTASRALEYLWQYVREVRHPRILDCGPALQASLSVLLKRGAKVYVADLLAPALRSDPAFWSRTGKNPIFLVDSFLDQLLPVPAEPLSVVLCWQLLDLVPGKALPEVVGRLWSYLQPGGVLFCVLREPYLKKGAGTRWWLESLTVLGSGAENSDPFLYPAITNREIERLVPGGNVKTFLTRAGRREVLGIK